MALRRLNIIIIVVGMSILVIGLVALAYAFWPITVTQIQETLSPTLFAPPP